MKKSVRVSGTWLYKISYSSNGLILTYFGLTSFLTKFNNLEIGRKYVSSRTLESFLTVSFSVIKIGQLRNTVTKKSCVILVVKSGKPMTLSYILCWPSYNRFTMD